MLHLLDEAQAILRLAAYATSRIQALPVPVALFEDETTVGFVYIFDSPTDLLERWQDLEQVVLSAHSVRLRDAGRKAWNVYSLFLTQLAANADTLHKMQAIDENLLSTRKIARAGIQTSIDLREALAPLLPLHSGASEKTDDYDQRLRRAIHTLTEIERDALFQADDPERIATRLVSLMDPDNAA